MSRFTSVRGRSNPGRARHAYDYSIRATDVAGGWYSLDGTLRANQRLTERQVRDALLADLIKQAKAQKGVTLRSRDLTIDHFTYTRVSRP